MSRYDEFRVFCYGSYDKAFLKKMRSKVTGKKRLDRVLERLTNVLSVVYEHIYFPCYTNGLKDVAACLGFAWSDKAASGIQSIVWRNKWQATQDDAWKQCLVTYNLEDCHALRRVAQFIDTLAVRSIAVRYFAPSQCPFRATCRHAGKRISTAEPMHQDGGRSLSFIQSSNSLIAVPISITSGSGCSSVPTSEYKKS